LPVLTDPPAGPDENEWYCWVNSFWTALRRYLFWVDPKNDFGRRTFVQLFLTMGLDAIKLRELQYRENSCIILASIKKLKLIMKKFFKNNGLWITSQLNHDQNREAFAIKGAAIDFWYYLDPFLFPFFFFFFVRWLG